MSTSVMEEAAVVEKEPVEQQQPIVTDLPGIPNILLITRVSRMDFIEDLARNVSQFAIKMHETFLGYVNVIWGIGVDTNKITPKQQKYIKEVVSKLSALKAYNNLFTFVVPSFTTNSFYASNIANDVWATYLHFCNKNAVTYNIPYDKSYVYLLDDDNAIHPNFAKMIQYGKFNELVMCHQLRHRDGGDVEITEEICADNCLGWIDSAQFILRQDVLKELGGYEDGYCIDGLTIKKYFETTQKPDFIIFPHQAAYYNYFTELLPNSWIK